MTTICFANDGEADLLALTTLGVSVKDEGAIGFFGTGFKYAVATLLRTGHRITVWVGDQPHRLTTRTAIIRGKQFEMICLDEQSLSITTELGRNWRVWQAYRELRCNATDEPGGLIAPLGSFDSLRPSPGRTVIEVTGEGIAQAHSERGRYFLETTPLHTSHVGSIHEGESRTIFYRGVAILELEKPTLYTYNFTEMTMLTEDRTMANTWMLPGKIGRLVAELPDREMLARVLCAPESYTDHAMTFVGASPSSEFMEVVAANRSNFHMSQRAKELWRALHPEPAEYEGVELDDQERHVMASALPLVWRADPDCRVGAEHFKVVASLGEGVLGLCDSRHAELLLSRAVLRMGIYETAATMYEEWLHRERGLSDESREMQNHLLRMLIRAAERAR